jgi:hypothetical protein
VIKKISIFLVFILISASLAGQDMKEIRNPTFRTGESLKYRVFYDSWFTSWLTAGYGMLTVSESSQKFHDQDVVQILITGKSTGMFNLFYKVDDRFESFFDTTAFVPWKFIRRTKEGKYVFDDDVIFEQYDHIAKSRRKEKAIPENIQDIVSAFYYMRTINFDSAKVNDEYYLNFYLDDSVYTSRIIFLGRENVETVLGKFRCLKFKPQVASGGIFQEPYPMVLWVTDDRNKIPVLGKSAVFVGSVTIELIEYGGLMYPVEAFLK